MILIAVHVLRPDGTEADRNELGCIACKLPLPPGTMSTLYKAPERFLQVYFSRFPVSQFYFMIVIYVDLEQKFWETCDIYVSSNKFAYAGNMVTARTKELIIRQISHLSPCVLFISIDSCHVKLTTYNIRKSLCLHVYNY
jgi:hypothetical protein